MEENTTESTLQRHVEDYYGTTLQHSSDLQTNACCVGDAPPPWLQERLTHIHPDVLDKFYGCGFPIPEALSGCHVLDLGCGTGRDVYLVSQAVGPDGHVHGVDMTEPQLAVAKNTRDWHMERFGFDTPNVSFHKGKIEDLSTTGLKDETLDVVISNCVVNLSARKDQVLSEVYRLLRTGGEFYFSDVFADRRLPEDVANDPILHAECLGGAMYGHDFIDLAKRVGFLDPRIVTESEITIENPKLQAKVGTARFYSVTLRLFKLPKLETRCEDYGQLAVYKGTIPEVGPLFTLDDHHLFEQNRPERICGNTAQMLASTRYGKHFDVHGTEETHYGEFVCSDTLAAQQYKTPNGDQGQGSCC